MAVDPNLTSDTSIFMNHGSPDWWLSNDVKLSNSNVAVVGQKNDISLTVRRNNNPLLADTEFIKVDLYVAVFTGSPFPLGGNSTLVKKILDASTNPAQEIVVDLNNLTAGSSNTQTVKWDLPAIPTKDAEKPGHKCLLARAYQSPLSGSANPDADAAQVDAHYAQHNICIDHCSPCGVDIATENPEWVRKPKDVTFRLFADLQPSESTLQVALPLLREVKGFRRVVNKAPSRGFALEMPDFPDAKMTDNTRPGCFSLIQGFLRRPKFDPSIFQPSFEAQVNIKPGQVSYYRFVTDLDGSELGDAHIFHLVHMEQGRVLSGLTIGMVHTGD